MQLSHKMWAIFSSCVFQWKIWSILRLTPMHVASYVLKMSKGWTLWYQTKWSIHLSQRFVDFGLNALNFPRIRSLPVPKIHQESPDLIFGRAVWQFSWCHFLMCCSEMNTANIGMLVSLVQVGYPNLLTCNEMIWTSYLIPLVNPTTEASKDPREWSHWRIAGSLQCFFAPGCSEVPDVHRMLMEFSSWFLMFCGLRLWKQRRVLSLDCKVLLVCGRAPRTLAATCNCIPNIE